MRHPLSLLAYRHSANAAMPQRRHDSGVGATTTTMFKSTAHKVALG
jgi:hypothetical protein